MIKVLLVDDNALFRDGIVQILHADGRFQVVGQASDGAEGIAAAGRLIMKISELTMSAAVISQIAMAAVCLAFVLLGVKSFAAARQNRSI